MFNVVFYCVQHFTNKCQTVEKLLPGKKGSEPRRVHTGLRLDAAILKRLAEGERGVSEEIRARLERSFAEDDFDPATRELRDAIVRIAALIRTDSGCEWHEGSFAHECFAAAVAQRIAHYAPGEGVPRGGAVLDLFGDPKTIGHVREQDERRAHAYPVLKSAIEAAPARRRNRIVRAMRHSKKKEGNHE
jgi:hypothetical protein